MPDLTWQVIKSRSNGCLEYSKKKVVGEPDEGKPHVRFEVAGNGNQPYYAQAPFPDPTTPSLLRSSGRTAADPAKPHAGQAGWILSARALRWAMVAVDCSPARSHR